MKSKPYTEGRLAYVRAVQRGYIDDDEFDDATQNPYSLGTLEHVEFEFGLCDAYLDFNND